MNDGNGLRYDCAVSEPKSASLRAAIDAGNDSADDLPDVMDEAQFKAAFPSFAWTWDRDEHPEGWDEGCACRECRWYANQ